MFDGTSALQSAPRADAAAVIHAASWAAVAFAISENDPTCGPGRWSLTQLWLPLSQVSNETVDIQVQMFTADVSVRGSVMMWVLQLP